MEPPSEPLRLHSIDGPRTLREQVAHALRAAVVAGELRPGVVYSAPVLARQLGVSATPVREAVLDLVQQGLVEPVRNRGFRVTVLSERDLDELTALRLLIEVPTVASLAERGADVSALRPLAERIERAAADADLIGYVEADRRFHLALLAFADNRWLVEIAGDLRVRSRLAERGLLIESAREHAALLDRITARDELGTRALIERHISQVRRVEN